MSPPRRPSASRTARRPPERHWTRYAAPAAFLLAATIAVLLVRSGLRGAETPTTTRPVTAVSTQKARSKPATTRKAGTTRRTGAARYYTVVAGDTFGTIASKNGTTVAAIEALNPGIKSTSLFIGQRIRVG